MKQSRYNLWTRRPDGDFVFNVASGAMLRLRAGAQELVERALADRGFTACPPRYLEQMARGRMLVPDDADELDALAARYRMTRDDPTHFALTILTSLGCNFACPYCFEAKHASILAPDVAWAILAVLDAELPSLRSFEASWFGGEPLVGKRSLLALSDELIARCDAAGVGYHAMIVTNGYLLDEATCVALRDRHVSFAQVSLDGPADVHDRMRPLANGGPTFGRILENLEVAVDYFDVSVRMNVAAGNFGRARELLEVLAAHGLAGRVHPYVGQIVGVDDGAGAPSSTYGSRCFTSAEFAAAELAFDRLAAEMGFLAVTMPRPTGAPCTAVRRNELVVGSEGELYKCWNSAGNGREVIGHIRDVAAAASGSGVRKWLAYDPFRDEECRGCVALPVCMGGCAHHAFDLLQHHNRCGTFRHAHRARLEAFVDAARRDRLDDAALVPATGRGAARSGAAAAGVT